MKSMFSIMFNWVVSRGTKAGAATAESTETNKKGREKESLKSPTNETN